MDRWQFIDGIIRHPPFAIVAILVGILVAHALTFTFEFITRRRGPYSPIITLELIVVTVLGYLVVHAHVEKSMRVPEMIVHDSEPFLLTCLLVFFTIFSMIIYVFYKAATKSHDKK